MHTLLLLFGRLLAAVRVAVGVVVTVLVLAVFCKDKKEAKNSVIVEEMPAR